MSDMFCKANAFSDQVEKAILSAGSIGFVGHIHPDGDDVGSCLGLARYASILNPKAEIRVFLERFSKDFLFLAGANEVIHDFSSDWRPELCIALDCADEARLGEAVKYYRNAENKILIDHHKTNDGELGGLCIIEPERSSTSELVCSLIDMSRLDGAAAQCLYLGIVHDTGVFKHSNTTLETMSYAGKLIELGADNSYIIDNTFYKKTFEQNRALGQILLNAKLIHGGKAIISSFTLEEMKAFGVTPADLDGCIDQLRVTEGVEVAAFIYQQAEGLFKVSFRSKTYADISVIAQLHGGGGHVHAAGCEIRGRLDDIEKTVIEEIAKQL